MATAALPIPTVSPASPAPAPTPNFAAIKTKQQATWASGDFSRVASRIVYYAEQLAESANLQAGWRVLDVCAAPATARFSKPRWTW